MQQEKYWVWIMQTQMSSNKSNWVVIYGLFLNHKL